MYVSFTVVLDIIICFSAHFWDNSTLMLKIRFQVFSSTSKNIQGFSGDMKISMLLLSVLFYLYKTISQFFEILILSHGIWGNVHNVPEMNLIS